MFNSNRPDHMFVINNKEFSLEDINKNLQSSSCKEHFAKSFGFTYFNGRISKILDKIIQENNLDSNHFDKYLANRRRAKYKKIIKDCPVCNGKFETLKDHPKESTTCGAKCANTYFAYQKHTEESKNKVREKLRKKDDSIIGYRERLNDTTPLYKKQCPYCLISFDGEKKQKCCSQSCATKLNWENPEYRNNQLVKVRERIDNGTHKGWASRSKLIPSFPEKVTMELLEELEIKHLIREHKCGKWFIDFADIDKKIALEIDGAQHEHEDRKISDAQKDKYLKQDGWKVFRIKWKKLTPDTRKFLKEQVEKIFK